jgi:hypothetical protein
MNRDPFLHTHTKAQLEPQFFALEYRPTRQREAFPCAVELDAWRWWPAASIDHWPSSRALLSPIHSPISLILTPPSFPSRQPTQKGKPKKKKKKTPLSQIQPTQPTTSAMQSLHILPHRSPATVALHKSFSDLIRCLYSWRRRSIRAATFCRPRAHTFGRQTLSKLKTLMLKTLIPHVASNPNWVPNTA